MTDAQQPFYGHLLPRPEQDRQPVRLGSALEQIASILAHQGRDPEPALVIDDQPTPMQGGPAALDLATAEVWIDVETYRWAAALGLGREYLLYRLAQEITHNNRVDQDALFAAAPWSQAYTYRLLKPKTISAGESPFFRGSNGKWLYLRAEQHMSAHLARMLTEQGLNDVLDGRRPGLRKRRIAVDSSPAALYAAWLSTKGSSPISRQTLAGLWNVDERTVIRWDKAAGIKKHKHFAQSIDLRDERVPADRGDYRTATIGGQTVAMWQRPNAYSVPQAIREHPHKGQAKKIRLAVNAVLGTGQHLEKSARSHPFQTKNYIGSGNPVQAKRDYEKALRKHPFAAVQDYLYLGRRCWKKGDKRRLPGIWELREQRPGENGFYLTAPGRFRVNFA